MMEIETATMIGGPVDGKTLVVASEAERIRFPASATKCFTYIRTTEHTQDDQVIFRYDNRGAANAF